LAKLVHIAAVHAPANWIYSHSYVLFTIS